MRMTSLLPVTLAVLAIATSAPQATPGPRIIVDLYLHAGCPGSDPVTAPPPEDLQPSTCYSLNSTFKSGQFSLTYEGGHQKLQFFEDAACTNKTLELSNDGTTTGQRFTDSGKGWQGFIYLSYR